MLNDSDSDNHHPDSLIQGHQLANALRAVRFAEGDLAMALRRLPPKAIRCASSLGNPLQGSFDKLHQARRTVAELRSLQPVVTAAPLPGYSSDRPAAQA